MPIFLVSATAPPSLQDYLLKKFKLEARHTAFIRGPTNRPEIGLHTLRIASPRDFETLGRLVFALMGRLAPEERMLVFFNNCTDAQNFATEHGFAYYHSQCEDNDAEKGHNLSLWDGGRTKVMACTSAFGAGVDRSHVRFVVMLDPIYTLTGALQMAGRAGRDGRESHVFFVGSGKAPSSPKDRDGNMAWELGQLVHGRECKVFWAMRHMDGSDFARRCRDLPGQVRCDRCDPASEVHEFARVAMEPLAPSPNAITQTGSTNRASPSDIDGTDFSTAHRMVPQAKFGISTRSAHRVRPTPAVATQTRSTSGRTFTNAGTGIAAAPSRRAPEHAGAQTSDELPDLEPITPAMASMAELMEGRPPVGPGAKVGARRIRRETD